jgi:hypothetical protein
MGAQEKAKTAALAEASKNKEKEQMLKDSKTKGKDKSGGKGRGRGRDSGMGIMGFGVNGRMMGPTPMAAGGGAWGDAWDQDMDVGEMAIDDDDQGDDDKAMAATSKAPEGAMFETLSDGSYALLVPKGMRMRLDLNDILVGGDARKQERDKQARKRRKRIKQMWGGSSWAARAWGDAGKDGAVWKGTWKEWVNEYTITMDVKLLEEPAREGVSLYQTALIHAEESKHGRHRLKQSDGEAIISSSGGVGVLGTFGDVTKAKVKVQ